MSTQEHGEQGTIPPENLWDTVQLPNGKQIQRADAREIKERRFECPDPGHSGGYVTQGECRICGQQMVETEMMVRWTEST